MEFWFFFIGNEPAIRRKGILVGGVCHLDHNKTLVLADGHLNESVLHIGDFFAGVQSVFHLVSQNGTQIYGGNLGKSGGKIYLVVKVDLGAGRLRRRTVNDSVNDVVSTIAQPDVSVGNLKQILNIILGLLILCLLRKI